MEITFFIEHCPAKTVGITGSKGKSTTTNLIYQILKKNLKQTIYLAGNIPDAPAIELLEKITEKDLVVLELSSSQLKGFKNIQKSPNISVLTSFFPDHLNYHSDIDDYLNDKLNIVRFQKKDDVFVTTIDFKDDPRFQPVIPGQSFFVAPNYFSDPLQNLFGKHNYSNASLALKVGELFSIPRENIVQTISEFKPLPYRLEYLGTLKEAIFYNDSASTNPTACLRAIEAISEKYPDKKIILVLGGTSKNLPYQELLPNLLTPKISFIHLLKGAFSEEIASLIDSSRTDSEIHNQFDTLFPKLLTELNNQTVVLFSPGAASFASFKNEFDRGAQFSQMFKKYQLEYGP